MRILFLLGLLFSAGATWGQNWFGLGNSGPPVDFGDQVTSAEVSQLVGVLESKSWDAKSANLTGIVIKLPVNAKYALYEKYKVAGAWGFLNVYGVGSFIQGDPMTSVITIAGLGIGLGINITTYRTVKGPERNIWYATSGAMVGGAVLYGLIRPWFFAEEKNRSLRSTLFTSE